MNSPFRLRTQAILTAMFALAALVVPLAGSALANHDNRLLDASPETESKTVGETHTITATLCEKDITGGPPATCQPSALPNDAAPVQVDFELESGPNNTDGDTEQTPDETCNVLAGQSTCSIDYVGDGGPGTDVWRVWIDHDGSNTTSEADPDEPRDESQDPPTTNGTNCPGAATPVEGPPGGEPDCTDVVQVTWSQPGGTPTAVDCDDENGPDRERETNPSLSGPQSSETYTCTVRDQNGDVIGDNDPNTTGNQDVVVKGENESGINDPDVTDGASYDSPDYQCTAGNSDDQGDPPVGQCTVTVNQTEGETGTAEICFWIGEDPATECGTEPTGEDPADTGSNTQGNDEADQVEKTWETRSAGEGDGGLDAEPETATNNTGDDHTITATVFDQFGEPFQGNTQVKFEFFSGSPSDTDGNNPSAADRTCTTNNSSSCSITYTSAEPGRDLVCVWTNTTPTMTGSNQNGECGGEDRTDGNDPAGAAEAPTPRDDDVDVVSKTWVNAEPATTLDCEPETDEKNIGATHTIECTATNEGGPVEDTEIDAEFTGANDTDGNSRSTPDDSCRTNADGMCTIEHTTTENGDAGTTTYRAWIDSDYFNDTVESDNSEGRDEGTAGGSSAEPDGTDVVENTWLSSGDRSISIARNKKRADRGEFVKISGDIDADSSDCEVGQSVRLKARRDGGKFKRIATQITDGNGEYVFRVKVFQTREYRTIAPANSGCDFAKSRIITVRRRS